MKNAVIYARYSSDHQREESIEGQLRECQDYATRNKYAIVGTYIDRALSAKTDDRPSFQRMIADSAGRAFDFIIVYTLDRFARNRYDSAVYKAKLKKHNVKVLSAKENISDGPEGIILEGMLEAMAEYYSAELAQKVKRGMKENALACRWASGRIPLGYKLDADKHLLLDEVKAPLVRHLFEMYADGKKVVDMIRYANSTCLKSGAGRSFARTSFQRMLASEIYIGTFKWADVRVENAVPPIVDRALFARCQLRLQTQVKRKYTVRRSDVYMLSSKLFCAECGAPVIGVSGTGRNGTHYYYTCSAARRKKTQCLTAYINRDALENEIIKQTVAILSNPEYINYIADRVVSINTQQNAPHIDYLKNQQTDLQGKLNNMMQAVERGLLSDALMARISDTEAELRKITAVLAEENEKSKAPKITKQHVAFFLTRYLNLDAPAAREFLLTSLLRRAEIKKERDGRCIVTVTFSYTDAPPIRNQHSFEILPETLPDADGSQNSATWWDLVVDERTVLTVTPENWQLRFYFSLKAA